MAVDVGDLVESLERAVNPPGINLFPNSTDGIYEGHLSDAFWELTMAGYISGFTEDEGIITEDVATPVTDLGRDFQQLMVMAAALNIITMLMINLNTGFRAVSGPVEFEQTKSGNVLSRVLDRLQTRYDDIVKGLDDSNAGDTTQYFDIISERTRFSHFPEDFYDGFVGY